MSRTPDPGWVKQYRQDRLRGISRYIDAAPTRHHIQHLQAAGASLRAIAEKAGMSVGAVSKIALGQPHIRRPSAARIQQVTPAAIFDRRRAGDYVPAVGARRRIEALQAIGHSSSTIAEAMGPAVTGAAVCHIKNQPGERISRDTYDRVVCAYSLLWDHPGTSRHTLNAARRLGFASPLAWDDDSLDDPAAVPMLGRDDQDVVDEVAVRRAMGGERLRLTQTERVEVVRRLAARGLSDNRIAGQLGAASRTIQQIRETHGITAGGAVA